MLCVEEYKHVFEFFVNPRSHIKRYLEPLMNRKHVNKSILTKIFSFQFITYIAKL